MQIVFVGIKNYTLASGWRGDQKIGSRR